MTTQPTSKPDRFQLLLDCPEGHRFFLDRENVVEGKGPRVAVADRSGRDLDRTDDGVLWLDTDRAIVAEQTGMFVVPLVTPAGRKTATAADAREAFMVGSTFGMKLDLGRVGAGAFTIAKAEAPPDPDANRLAKDAVRSIEAIVSMIEMIADALKTDDVARRLGGQLCASFASYLSCLASEREFRDETVGGLCNSLKDDVARAIERSRR